MGITIGAQLSSIWAEAHLGVSALMRRVIVMPRRKSLIPLKAQSTKKRLFQNLIQARLKCYNLQIRSVNIVEIFTASKERS